MNTPFTHNGLPVGHALPASYTEQKLRSLFMQAPAAIALLEGPEHIYTFANPLYQKLFGRTEEELIGKNVQQVFPEIEGQGIYELFHQVFTTGEPFVAGEFPATFQDDGKIKTGYYNFVIQPIKGDADLITDLMVHAYEVTSQVTAHKKVEESESRFRNLIEESTVAAAVLEGPEWVLTLANNRMLDLWQRDRSIIGQKLLYFMPELIGQPFPDLLKAVYETGITYSDEDALVLLNRGGKLENVYMDFSYKALRNAAGEVYAILVAAADVTERYSSKQQLQESENRFRLMADASPVMIWTLDAEGNSTYYNKRATDFTGHTEEELKNGKSWQTAIHPDDIDHAAQVVGNAVQNRLPYEMECRMRRADGEWRWLLSHGMPRLDQKAKFLGYVGSSIDITERKVAEEALIYRKAILEAQNEAMPDAALIVDTKGKMITFNHHFVTLWKIPQAIIDAKDDAAALQFAMTQVTDPEGFIDRVNYCYSHPEEACTEEVFFRDGRIIERYGNAVTGENGTKYGWIWYFRDITERKNAEVTIRESESRFRTLATSIPQIVWTTDKDGKLDYLNQQWEALTGQPVSEGLVQNHLLVHPEDLPVLAANWTTALQTGTSWKMDYRLKNLHTGEYRWFTGLTEPLKDKDGNIHRWVGTATDIHEQKQFTKKLEELVAERTKELQRSNEDLQQFAHVASHDLKEPVRKVKTFVNLLEQQLDGKLDETSARFLEKIHSATNRMFSMIDGVLAYSTINANTQTPQALDLNEVIKNIETDLEVVVQKTGTRIHYSHLPTLEGAPVLLYQLFYNLINNSIKFAKANVPPLIYITSEVITDHGNSFARIRLSDNGIGFEQEQAETIFDTFTRLNSKDKYEGTGLGLSLCKKIVQRHGGSITASGVLGKGATFTILLPLQ